MARQGTSEELALAFTARAERSGFGARVELASQPLLEALKRAGTEHVYADTADGDELGQLFADHGRAPWREVDGNTINQPLMRKVLDRHVDAALEGARALLAEVPGSGGQDAVVAAYTLACMRAGEAIVGRFAAGRPWEGSLQLHMALSSDRRGQLAWGRAMARAGSGVVVKVPFAPHEPECLLVARDLERSGTRVNFTSTFSARQVVSAALLADVTRTNVFLGRLDQGLSSEHVGEHTALEAQRALRRLRSGGLTATRLIVASIRDWRTLVDTAGCDVYTAPVDALRGLVEQEEVAPDAVESALETTYADRLGVPPETERLLARARIARLWTVEEELVEFLLTYRASDEFRDLQDGDRLANRFDEAGFGDLFYGPTPRQWQTIRSGKLPVLADPTAREIALDTLFTLHAHADFEANQAAMDSVLQDALGRGGVRPGR